MSKINDLLLYMTYLCYITINATNIPNEMADTQLTIIYLSILTSHTFSFYQVSLGKFLRTI